MPSHVRTGTTGPNSGTARPPSTRSSVTSTSTHPPSGTTTRMTASSSTSPSQTTGWPLAGASSTAPLTALPGASGRKVVALTFDDGPGPYTAKILEALNSRHVTATFCQIGRQVADFPEAEKELVADGNALCNHSWDHVYARTTALATIPGEIDRTNAAIAAATGVTPRVMRAPGGLWTTSLFAALRTRGMVPLGWDVDPDDWKRPGTAVIVSRVLAQVRPGAVILMHDGGGNRSETVAALPTIIDSLRGRGYSFTTL